MFKTYALYNSASGDVRRLVTATPAMFESIQLMGDEDASMEVEIGLQMGPHRVVDGQLQKWDPMNGSGQE